MLEQSFFWQEKEGLGWERGCITSLIFTGGRWISQLHMSRMHQCGPCGPLRNSDNVSNTWAHLPLIETWSIPLHFSFVLPLFVSLLPALFWPFQRSGPEIFKERVHQPEGGEHSVLQWGDKVSGDDVYVGVRSGEEEVFSSMTHEPICFYLAGGFHSWQGSGGKVAEELPRGQLQYRHSKIHPVYLAASWFTDGITSWQNLNVTCSLCILGWSWNVSYSFYLITLMVLEIMKTALPVRLLSQAMIEYIYSVHVSYAGIKIQCT